ncbi:MAG TPA: metallophosphoesterase [Planctomycetota bacterium]|jgi:predicted phosphodiesterase
MKTLILSDLHFGISTSKVDALLERIRSLSRDYDQVILNGDTLDRYEAPACEPRAERLLQQVTDACRCGGADPILISGNHDPAISNTSHIYLESSQTLVFHGDCLTDCTHPTRKSDQDLRVMLQQHWQEIGRRPENFLDLVAAYRKVQARFLRENPQIKEPRSTFGYIATILVPPRKPFDVFLYWWRVPGLAAALARTYPQPVRHVVIGHSHRAGRWNFGDLEVFNTGSFMPLSLPCVVSVEDAQVSFVPLRKLLKPVRTYLAPRPNRAAQPETLKLEP